MKTVTLALQWTWNPHFLPSMSSQSLRETRHVSQLLQQSKIEAQTEVTKWCNGIIQYRLRNLQLHRGEDWIESCCARRAWSDEEVQRQRGRPKVPSYPKAETEVSTSAASGSFAGLIWQARRVRAREQPDRGLEPATFGSKYAGMGQLSTSVRRGEDTRLLPYGWRKWQVCMQIVLQVGEGTEN